MVIIHLNQTLHLEKHSEEWPLALSMLHSRILLPNPAHALKSAKKWGMVTFNSSQVPIEANAVRSSEKRLKLIYKGHIIGRHFYFFLGTAGNAFHSFQSLFSVILALDCALLGKEATLFSCFCFSKYKGSQPVTRSYIHL